VIARHAVEQTVVETWANSLDGLSRLDLDVIGREIAHAITAAHVDAAAQVATAQVWSGH